VTEWQLFPDDVIPEYSTPEWYAGRDRAPHLEEGIHRGRLKLASEMATDAASRHGCASIVDLGAGDGGLLSTIGGIRTWGYDLQRSNVVPAQMERGVDVRYGDVVTGDIEWGDLAIATEMLEHLVNPHIFVRRIAAHSRVLVASSPYTETDKEHYAFHLWAWDMDGYRTLLELAGYRIERHETVDLFQVIQGVHDG
jgi:2-polyprenyl-3-methyl-5-hydroxy-6-metoxy-1,4-benzoquinol methylase